MSQFKIEALVMIAIPILVLVIGILAAVFLAG